MSVVRTSATKGHPRMLLYCGGWGGLGLRFAVIDHAVATN